MIDQFLWGSFMQPTFDTHFYKQSHFKLCDEQMKLSFSHREFEQKYQVTFAQWADNAGRMVRQKNVLPLFERYDLFEQTVNQYVVLSESRSQSLFEMEKLIEEFGVSNSNIVANSGVVANSNEEYQRHGSLSDKSKDKSQEFNTARVNQLSRAKGHISPI